MTDGTILGAGRNDDGQLGETETLDMGTLQKLTHIQNVEKIYSAAHYNYCKEEGSS